MHETSMNWRGRGFDFDRVIFPLPTSHSIQGVIAGIGGTLDIVRSIELKLVVPDILSAAAKWTKEARKEPAKLELLERLMQVRPDGIHPWVVGIPVIA